MPYTIENPPERIKDLPNAAKEIFIAAYNSALKEYPENEETVNKVAWAAVKNAGYMKNKEGNWVKFESEEAKMDEKKLNSTDLGLRISKDEWIEYNDLPEKLKKNWLKTFTEALKKYGDEYLAGSIAWHDLQLNYDKNNKIDFKVDEDVLFPDSFEIKLSSKDIKNKKSKVQVAREGQFFHPIYGNVDFSEKAIDMMIENFNNAVYGSEPYIGLPFDPEHIVDMGALGWIKNLTKEQTEKGCGLFAEVEWTDLGVEMIKSKRFQYTSLSFFPEYTDAETKKKYKNVVRGAALTVDPYIKGMKPVSLSRLILKNESNDAKQQGEVKKQDFSKKEEIKLSENKKETNNSTELSVEELRQLLDLKAKEIASKEKAMDEDKKRLKELEEKTKKMEEDNKKLSEAKLSMEQEVENLKRESIEKEVENKVNAWLVNEKGEYNFKQDQKETLVKFLTNLKNLDCGLINLSNLTEEKVSLSEQFISIVDSIPKTEVNLKEKGHSQSAGEISPKNDENRLTSKGKEILDDRYELDKKINDYAKQNNLSYRDAMLALQNEL